MIDLDARRVWQDNREIEFSAYEYAVLAYLAARLGQIVSYAELWEKVWKATAPLERVEQNTVRAVLKRIRKKLNDDAQNPAYLVVTRARGVRLRASSVKVRKA